MKPHGNHWPSKRQSAATPRVSSSFSLFFIKASFLFLHFKKNYRNIFWFSKFTVLYPYHPVGGGRGPTARQGGGRGLYINKYKFYLRIGPWRGPAAPLPGGRPPCRLLPLHHLAAGGLPPGRGAAGSLQRPLRKKNYFYLHIGPYRSPAGR